jgi:putative DNA primase/helicase
MSVYPAPLSLAKLADALGGEVTGGQVLAPGPGHSPQDRSLSVKPDVSAPDGFICHSFANDDAITCRDYVRQKLGLPAWKPGRKVANGKAGKPYSPTIAKYVYRTAEGAPYLRVDRLADKSAFPQYHWDGELWKSGKPNGPKIPYRLPELLAAPLTNPIFVVEGEKDADKLAKIGFVATCNSEGADNGDGNKWTGDLNPYFKDRTVYIIPDNDAAGRKHAEHVARSLDPIAKSVRIVELPGLPHKGDVSDWLLTDAAGARLVKECERAPLWEPGALRGTGGTGDEELITELASLSPLEYAKRRKKAAAKVGIGVGELDKIVGEARGEPEPEVFDDRWGVEPWHEAVATADLLQELRETYSKYVILPEHGATAMALWTLHAWTHDASYVSPFIMFTSPTPRCGKTVAMALLQRTGPRTIQTSNISPAAVFRFIEAHHPTLIIDEADSFVRDNEDMRGILNSGHTRDGAYVIRCEGDNNEPRKFSTWAPKAVAGIGKLAATLRDRAIILPMKRKRPADRVAKLCVRDTEEFIDRRRKAARWASDNLEPLRDAAAEIPGALNDRAQDNWQPLLAIAELGGSEWAETARAAAVALSREIDGERDPSCLLADIRDVFAATGLDRLTTKYLISRLVEDETKPWGAFTKDGKPITADRLARLLGEFEIKPRTLRIGEATAKGYLRVQFEDAWERYAPSQGPQPVTPSQSIEINDLEPPRPVTPEINVTGSSRSNPLKNTNCDGVTGSDPGSNVRNGEDRVCAQCHGRVDGTEQECALGDRTVWLHRQCQRFYLKALEER